MLLFERPGRENTQAAIDAAVKRAEELGLRHIVISSNTGESVRPLLGRDVNVVCVTHQVGFRRPGEDEMTSRTREEFAKAGVKVLTTTHLFSGIERAVQGKYGGLYPGGIVANALRLFGEGMKVCVEIAVMALDAGLIPYNEKVIAIGGTGRGVDTAIVLTPAHSRQFFDTKIHEIICKPSLY